MTLKDMLLPSVLSGGLALAPLALHAQDYDTWTLDREILNSAANYTGTLTTAHGEVRKYITWNWNTVLDEAQQRERTDAILRQITGSQQIDGTLVRSLDMDVVNSYDIRFRYCDNKLLSYFAASGFKHGLSAQQIVDAPELRAQRAGATFYGEPLGIVARDGDGLNLQTYGGRSTPIPACMGADYGGALAEGTVAYMTSAAQKFGVARIRKRRETRKLPCKNGDVGSGIRQERFLSTDYNARNDPLYNAQSVIPYDPQNENLKYPYYDTATLESDGNWRIKYSHCRPPATIPVRRIEECAPGSDRVATYRYFLTEAYDPKLAGTDDFAETVWLPSDRTGNLTGNAVGELVPHLSFCDGSSPPPSLEPRISRRQESRAGSCPATHPLGTITEAREMEIRRYSFADSPDIESWPMLSEIVTEIEGPWAVSDDRCYRNVDERTPDTKVSSCPSGQTGSVSYQREQTVIGVDWHWDGWVDQLTTDPGRWTVTTSSCQTRRRTCHGRNVGDTGADCVQPDRGGSRGGGGGHDGSPSSIDVDGDGQGDYSNSHNASRAGHSTESQTEVGTTCGACNGPSPGGPTSGGMRGGSSPGGGSFGGGGGFGGGPDDGGIGGR